jgi:hypothetical protein
VSDGKKTDPAPPGTGPDELTEMVRRAEAGDPAAMEWIHGVLARPGVVDLVGNLARQVELIVLERLAGKDPLYREAVTRKLGKMRQDLAGPSPTPVEAALAERATLDWLVLHEAELRLAAVGEGARAAFWQKRVNFAHRQYIAALKGLAAVRRLPLSVLVGQVNIAAGDQVNTQWAPT